MQLLSYKAAIEAFEAAIIRLREAITKAAAGDTTAFAEVDAALDACDAMARSTSNVGSLPSPFQRRVARAVGELKIYQGRSRAIVLARIRERDRLRGVVTLIPGTWRRS